MRNVFFMLTFLLSANCFSQSTISRFTSDWRMPVGCTTDSSVFFHDTLAFFNNSSNDIPASLQPPFGCDYFLLPQLIFNGDSVSILYNCYFENPDGKIVYHDSDTVVGSVESGDQITGAWKQLNGADEKEDPIIECVFPIWNAKFTWRLENHDKYWLLIRLK